MTQAHPNKDISLSYHQWKDRAQKLFLPDEWLNAYQGKCLIGEKFVPAQDGRVFANHSPIDNRLLNHIARGGEAEIDQAVSAARQAFDEGPWPRMAPNERMKILREFADLVAQNGEELALLDTLDMGKPIHDSLHVDFPCALDCLYYFAEAGNKIHDEIAPTPSHILGMVFRQPLGVIGAVIPWNFPMLMVAWKLAPALAVGNTIILKPAEQSPLSALHMGKLALEAGFPPGVINVIPGFGEEAGKALGLHPQVDGIAFTGSTAVGKQFMIYAGQSNLKQIWPECGGKTPHIVLADAVEGKGDMLDRIAREVVSGIFSNQGEVCNAGSRLIVEEKIHDILCERILSYAQEWQPGDPLHPQTRFGAMVSQEHQKKVLEYMEIGRQEGAREILRGGACRQDSGGFYISGSIFDQVDPKMRIAQEEIFGPVLSILTARDFAHALELANDTVYGLAAAIWTGDMKRAHYASRALQAGSIWVNCFDGGDVTTPFGGTKQSGFGSDKSLHAMEKFTYTKTIWVDHS